MCVEYFLHAKSKKMDKPQSLTSENLLSRGERLVNQRTAVGSATAKG